MRLRLPPDALTPRDPLGIPIDTDMIQWLPEGISAAPSFDSSPADLQDAALLFNRIGTSTDAHFGAAGINASGETGAEYFASKQHLANIAGHSEIGSRTAVLLGDVPRAGSLAAAAAAIIGPLLTSLPRRSAAELSAQIGGVIAALAGGRFRTGADIASLGYRFNESGSNFQRGYGVQFLDDRADPVLTMDGKAMFVPDGVDMGGFVDQGLADSGNPAAIAANLFKFRHGGPWDLQRPGNVPAFVDPASVAIGLYGAAAGVPFDRMMRVQQIFARIMRPNWGNVPISEDYSPLPKRNEANTRKGYDLFNTGAIASRPGY